MKMIKFECNELERNVTGQTLFIFKVIGELIPEHQYS